MWSFHLFVHISLYDRLLVHNISPIVDYNRITNQVSVAIYVIAFFPTRESMRRTLSVP